MATEIFRAILLVACLLLFLVCAVLFYLNNLELRRLNKSRSKVLENHGEIISQTEELLDMAMKLETETDNRWVQ